MGRGVTKVVEIALITCRNNDARLLTHLPRLLCATSSKCLYDIVHVVCLFNEVSKGDARTFYECIFHARFEYGRRCVTVHRGMPTRLRLSVFFCFGRSSIENDLRVRRLVMSINKYRPGFAILESTRGKLKNDLNGSFRSERREVDHEPWDLVDFVNFS